MPVASIMRETVEKIRTYEPVNGASNAVNVSKSPTYTKYNYKIRRYTDYRPADLADAIAVISANIEDAYQMMGIRDYTAEQCVAKAMMILTQTEYKDKWGTELTIGWPEAKDG